MGPPPSVCPDAFILGYENFVCLSMAAIIHFRIVYNLTVFENQKNDFSIKAGTYNVNYFENQFNALIVPFISTQTSKPVLRGGFSNISKSLSEGNFEGPKDIERTLQNLQKHEKKFPNVSSVWGFVENVNLVRDNSTEDGGFAYSLKNIR